MDELVTGLQGRGYFAEGLHGDMKQQQRDRVMNGFRKGRTDILVATDVAARGIDVDDVDVVFNYDLPQDEEYYVHRIGRTGRAGRTGLAFSFVVGREVYKLKEIQRYCKTKIAARPIPSLNDVASTKAEMLFRELGAIIADQDLTPYIDMIEAHVNEEDYTAMDIAAAFLKMNMREGTGVENMLADDEFGDTGAEEGMVRLFINVGRQQKARPGDILGPLPAKPGFPGA